MRVALIGCVRSSLAALRALQALDAVELVGVLTRYRSAFNADFVDLGPAAGSTPTLHVDRRGAIRPAEWLKARQPDLVLCVGWSRLLPEAILRVPPKGVIGYHPAPLPRGRGRHPIIWSIALGLEASASTFFLMDAGADSGPIVDQAPFTIGPEDDAGTVYARVLRLIPFQLARFIPLIAADAVSLIPQDPKRATTWRKRSPIDGRIDWRMAATTIHNLVRALAPPYPGASCATGSGEAIIWRTERATVEAPDAEPGRVLRVEGGAITIKCGVGALLLVDHTIDPLPPVGGYL